MSHTHHLDIIAFYPTKINNEKGVIEGSLHVKLLAHNLDIRGCRIFASSKTFHAMFPHKEEYDPKEKKIVMFPLFNFADLTYNAQIKAELIRKCVLFIHENNFEDQNNIKQFRKIKERHKKKFKPKGNYNKPKPQFERKPAEPLKTEVIDGKVWTEYKPRAR